MISEAVARLSCSLFASGVAWAGPALRCERRGDDLVLTALGSSGAMWTSPRISSAELMLTPKLLAELGEQASAFDESAAPLDALVGRHTTKAWEQRDAPHQLKFDFDGRPAVILPAEILGSFSASANSWCWSWANRSYAPDVTAAALAL